MRSRLQQLRREEGFTVLELLAAVVVGLIVLMAAFALLDTATSTSNAIADRQDALQRGRLAMERVTSALRSQICLGENTEPITAGNENGLTFYANLSSNPDAAQQRTLIYDPTTKRMTQQIREGTGTYPDLAFPLNPTRTEAVLDGVGRMVENGVTQPLFRYFAYTSDGSLGEMEQLTVPLTTLNASRVAMVKVAFKAMPDRRVTGDRDSTSLQSDIYVRLADPTRPAEGPRCM